MPAIACSPGACSNAGVRFVQLFNGAYAMGEGVGNWDGHKTLKSQYDVHGPILDRGGPLVPGGGDRLRRDAEQFGKPIGGFQLTQSKLAWMLADLPRAQLIALHLGRLKEAGELTPEQVSLGKMSNVRAAIEIARQARTILGANGITLEYPVIRHANNLESVLTYEGTEEIHALTLGQVLTGLPAFR